LSPSLLGIKTYFGFIFLIKLTSLFTFFLLNEAKIKINNMGLDKSILDRPFNFLDNSDLKKLSRALRH